MAIFQIDQQSRVPLYEQLKRQVLNLAALGLLEENEQMPSVRQLASDLGINPNTVQKAYRELERDGLIYTLPGRGSFLAATDAHVDAIKEGLHQRLAETIEMALRSGFSQALIEDLFAKVLAEKLLEHMSQGPKLGQGTSASHKVQGQGTNASAEDGINKAQDPALAIMTQVEESEA
ncbi:MAG: GntR family transcriptional regulator [Eubacteriales bacterium]|nr:GntR family transcriptional regulator [Clostridiales bacterium]MDY5836012.1 GntR family transcriptional regulator [Eubacteriales bacterium]